MRSYPQGKRLPPAVQQSGHPSSTESDRWNKLLGWRWHVQPQTYINIWTESWIRCWKLPNKEGKEMLKSTEVSLILWCPRSGYGNRELLADAASCPCKEYEWRNFGRTEAWGIKLLFWCAVELDAWVDQTDQNWKCQKDKEIFTS